MQVIRDQLKMMNMPLEEKKYLTNMNDMKNMIVTKNEEKKMVSNKKN